jgi:putative tricarboxylic transport membrane protein
MKQCQKMIGVVLSLCMVFAWAAVAAAADFPEKEIRIITGTGAGGGVDRMTRAVQRYLPDVIGQSVLVENRKGAGGKIGLKYVLGQPRDGYTIYAYHQPGVTNIIKMNPGMLKIDDLAYINITWIDPTLIVAQKSLGWKSMDDFINAAKKDPGKYSFAAPSSSSAGTVMAKLLFDKLGLKIKIVPYGSGGSARAAFQGGHADMTGGGAAGMLVVENMATPLALFWKNKIPTWPNCETLNSQLASHGVKIPNAGSYRLFAVPREVKDKYPEHWNKLVSSFKKLITENKEFKAYCDKQEIGTEWLGPEESLNLVKEVDEVFSKVKAK